MRQGVGVGAWAHPVALPGSQMRTQLVMWVHALPGNVSGCWGWGCSAGGAPNAHAA